MVARRQERSFLAKAGRDVARRAETQFRALWIVNVETGAKRLLIESDAMQPAWSPHGDRIAFWFMPPSVGRSDIATISRDGGEPVVITKDASTNWNPVWSPDGKYLVFRQRSQRQHEFLARRDRRRDRQSSGRAGGGRRLPSKYSRHLNFSRDGKRMIYVQTE